MRINMGICGKCKKPLRIIRTDRIPFCSECEKKVTAEAERIVPKIAKKGKLALRSEYVAKES